MMMIKSTFMMARSTSVMPQLAITLLTLISLLPSTLATIYSPRISTCRSSSSSGNIDPASLINISQAWAQIFPPERAKELRLAGSEDDKNVLRINLLGETGAELVGFSNETGKLATLFQKTEDLTFNVWSTATFLCNSLFPASPLPYDYIPQNTTYCPLAPGPLAINISIPLSSHYGLSTLENEFRIVDSSVPAIELACIRFSLSPYYPADWYWSMILWIPAGLAIGYWISSWAGRFAAGWVVGRGGEVGEDDVDARVGLEGDRSGGRKWGTMLVSGLSGERLGVSGGLLRFITPGFRDVIWHLQFIGVLGMTAVQWPNFVYPILAQTGWSNLVGNVTLVQGTNAANKHRDLLSFFPSPIPEGFADQVSNTSSPLYLDSGAQNMFMNMRNSADGLESFATAVGLRPRDMYGTCVSLFLSIGAGIIALSLLVWIGHAVIDTLFLSGKTHSPSQSIHGIGGALSGTATSRKSMGGTHRASESYTWSDYDLSLGKKSGGDSLPPTPGIASTFGPGIASSVPNHGHRQTRWKKGWAKFKLKGPMGAFHFAALCGNLVRILILFHLPLTMFSVYQWTIRDVASLASVILSALSFAVFSVLLPIYLLIQVSTTPTAKLYDAMRTLLSLGPLYNIYAQGNQLYQALRFVASLATGIAIGAGQNNGTAQAIVLLIIEIAFGLVTTIWQPWRPGAGMVVPGFLFTIIRIASTVLLLILSPAVAIGNAVSGWIAYTILCLQGVALLAFLIMLISKVLEGLIRLFGNVKFADSTHALDGGLFAAFGGLSQASRRKKRKAAGKGSVAQRSSMAGSVNTQMMLDRFSTNTTAGPISPIGHGRSGSAGYFPGQAPGGWPALSSPSGYARVSAPHEEVLQDEAPAGARGFSVIRGGKATYEDPYRSLPGAEGEAGPSSPNQYAYQPRPMLSPEQHSSYEPKALASSGAPRHARTKSQTAVVESLPSSLSDSPHSQYPHLPGSGENTPGWTPGTTPTAENFFARDYARQTVPLALQRIPREEYPAHNDSPTSEYSGERAEGKRSRPTSWFGLGSGKRTVSADSDEEEELDEMDVRTPPEPVRQGSWLSSLGLSSDKRMRSSLDEKRVDENALRKSNEVILNDDVAGPATGRSFKVHRNKSSSTSRSIPLRSIPSSPQATSAELPSESGRSQAPPARGFVVNRAPRSGYSSANPSQPTSPATAPMSLESHEPAPQEPGRSFVVNRQNRPPGSVSFASAGGAGNSRSSGSQLR